MATQTRIRTSRYQCTFADRRTPPAPAGEASFSVHFKYRMKVEYLSRRLGSNRFVVQLPASNYKLEKKFRVHGPSLLLSRDVLQSAVHHMMASMPVLRLLDLSPSNWDVFTPHDVAADLHGHATGKAAGEGWPVGGIDAVVAMDILVTSAYDEAETMLKVWKAAFPQRREPGSSELCAICLQDFTAEAPQVDLPCSHAFHGDCILSWMRRGTTCPLCRCDLSRQVAMPPAELDALLERLYPDRVSRVPLADV